jgi:palmitoyltransferase ZDHHC9/14/18
MRFTRSTCKALPTVQHQSSSQHSLPARVTCTKVTTYNLVVLAGTANHTPKKYRNKHHKLSTRSIAKPVIQRDCSSFWANDTQETGRGQTDFDEQAEAQLLVEAAHAAQCRCT